jgi:hypothetical protein
MSSQHCYALPRGNSNIYQIHQGDLKGVGSIDLRVDRSIKLFSLFSQLLLSSIQKQNYVFKFTRHCSLKYALLFINLLCCRADFLIYVNFLQIRIFKDLTNFKRSCEHKKKSVINKYILFVKYFC